MTAKEELSQYKYLKDKVQETLDEYEKYKTRAEKMTSIISDMPKGGKSSDKVADNSVAMADLSRKYEELWIRTEQEKFKIEQKICLIAEPYQTLLRKRYLKDMNFEKIADEMGYTYNTITHMHGDALEEYKKIQDITY